MQSDPAFVSSKSVKEEDSHFPLSVSVRELTGTLRDPVLEEIQNYGKIKQNSNLWSGAFHIFKANVGSGVFLLPTFYKDAGYIMSPILQIVVATALIECTHFLLHVKQSIVHTEVQTYSDICRYIFGSIMEWFLFINLCLTQFAFPIMYTQIAAYTLMEWVHFPHADLLFCAVIFCLIFPCTLFSDNLAVLAIISVAATGTVFVALGGTFIRSCMTIASLGISKNINPVGTSIPLGWFNNIANNMVMLEGIAIVIPVENSTRAKYKSGLKMMITTVLILVITLYLTYGTTGYLAYGNDITISLINLMPQDALGIFMRVCMVVTLLCTYPIQFLSAIQLVDKKLKTSARALRGIIARVIANFIICALAYFIGPKNVTIVIGIVGALPATMMVFIIPTFLLMQFEYAESNEEENRTTFKYWLAMFTKTSVSIWVRIRCYIYITFAILTMVLGTMSVIKNI